MSAYYLVENSAVVRGPVPRSRCVLPNVSIGANATDAELATFGWYKEVKVGDELTADSNTEVKEGPVQTVEDGAGIVTLTWTVRPMNSTELSELEAQKQAAKEARVDNMEDLFAEVIGILFAICFAQQNEIRVLQGKSEIPETATGAETFLNAADALPRLDSTKLRDKLKALLG